ncbi:ATP-binding protein [Sphingobacterium sp. JUb20]|uniref:ATP-binding protein n=1 Tax=unclassified Sphingobacterium TaxID=2609468 RepID=UPI0010445B5C
MNTLKKSVSLIITTQIPVEKWHGLIGESTIADTILDIVTFSSHRVEFWGSNPIEEKEF